MDLTEQINKYRWYHRIKVSEGVETKPDVPRDQLWGFIIEQMRKVDFKGKRVLDVACRDCLFTFEAERLGASDLVGIDNCYSHGTAEVLIPHFKSKVHLHEMNLYDAEFSAERFGSFDRILFFGLLYHLRYPTWALKKVVDCLSEGGLLLIESAMLLGFENHPILYCPVEDNPYNDLTSCTFFNRKGLETTMRSLGCKMLDFRMLEGDPNTKRDGLLKRVFGNGNSRLPVGRCFAVFQKSEDVRRELLAKEPGLYNYWDGTHTKPRPA